ncbi:MAG: hypothetical protein ABSB88_18220 [Bryobacteraceae bacterium]
MKALREIRRRHDIQPLAIHVNYLVNLASRDPAIRAKSLETFRGELERLLANAKLRRKVFISETPVEIEGDDRRNLETLKSLAP